MHFVIYQWLSEFNEIMDNTSAHLMISIVNESIRGFAVIIKYSTNATTSQYLLVNDGCIRHVAKRASDAPSEITQNHCGD